MFKTLRNLMVEMDKTYHLYRCTLCWKCETAPMNSSMEWALADVLAWPAAVTLLPMPTIPALSLGEEGMLVAGEPPITLMVADSS